MKRARKKGTTRRLLGVLLAAAMTTTSLPAFALPVAAAQTEETARTITVTFDANGGTGEMKPLTLEVPEGATAYTFQNKLPVCEFTNGDKHFLGWAKADNMSRVVFSDYGSYNLLESSTLYAVWGAGAEIHRITFQTNGGGNQPDLWARKDSYVPLPEPLYGKDNGTFDGYRNTETGDYHGARSWFYMGDSDVKLKMEWLVADTSLVGPAPEFANTSQWAKGVYYTEPKYGPSTIAWNPGEPYLGWADTNQGSYPYCFFVAGINAVHWWFDRNEDFVKYYEPFTETGINPQYKGEETSDLWNFFKWNGGYVMMGHAKTDAPRWWIVGDENADPALSQNKGTIWAKGGFFKEVFSTAGTDHYRKILPEKSEFTQAIVEGLKNDRTFYMAYGEGDGHALTIWGAHFDNEGYVDELYTCESNGSNIPFTDSSIDVKKVMYKDGIPRITSVYSNDELGGDRISELDSLPASRKVWNDYYLRNETGKGYLKTPEPSKSGKPQEGTTTITSEFNLQDKLNGSSGTVQLGKDIALKDTAYTISRSVILDLNGHTLRGSYGKPVLTIQGDGTKEITVVIKDSSKGQTGTITGGVGTAKGTGGVLVKGEKTHLYFESGTITGNRGMYGGGMYIEDGATVTMNGGKIVGNQADTCVRSGLGGGVYVSGASFVMNDGEISGNFANSTGGGVAVGVCGQFIMKGGVIKDNSTKLDYSADVYGGGGVSVYSVGAKAHLLGGQITGNRAEGKASFGGGVLATYGGSVTLGDTIQISDNTENGKPSNILIDGDYPESMLNIEELKNDVKIGVSLKGEKTGRFLSEGQDENVAHEKFVSDDSRFRVSNGDLVADKSNYSISYDEDLLSVMYGMSFTVPVTVLDNGSPCAKEGRVVFRTANGTEISADVDENGTATVGGSPLLGNYQWNIGENEIDIRWIDNQGNVRTEEKRTFSMSRYTIQPECIVWGNTEGRIEGDSKAVTAQFKTSDATYKRRFCIPVADLGKVEFVLEGHREQERGDYVAKVVGIKGEKAGFYQLEYNLWFVHFQKEYSIAAGENRYTMTLTPEEAQVSDGEELTMDVFVKQGGMYCEDGTVSLSVGGTELQRTEVRGGMARFVFRADKRDISIGRNVITASYIPKGQSESAAKAENIVELVSGKVQRLDWNGTIEARGNYGVKLCQLEIDTKGVFPTFQGREVKGDWHFRSNDENVIPDCTGKTDYEMVFRPAAGEGNYAQLTQLVTPQVEKMGQRVAPQVMNSHVSIHATSIVVNFPENFLLGKGNAQLEYAVKSSGMPQEDWQTSPVLSGLTPGTGYVIYTRYAECDNYKVSTMQSSSRIITLTESVTEGTLDLTSYPAAEGTFGDRLEQIPLTGGVVKKNGNVVSGNWTWEDDQIQPPVGATKSYNAIFSTSDGDSVTVAIYPNIKKAEQSPAMPVKKDCSLYWVELEAVNNPLAGSQVQYGVVSGVTGEQESIIWQDSPRFMNLKAGTDYRFYVKYLGTDTHREGISQPAVFSTAKQGEVTLAAGQKELSKKETIVTKDELRITAGYGSENAIEKVLFQWKPDGENQGEWRSGLPSGKGVYRVRISLPDCEDEVTETYYVGRSEEVIVRLGEDTTEPEVPDKPETITKGDVNGDGRVDLLDLRMVLRHICKKDTLTGNALKAANMVGEEESVDLLDLRALLRTICGKAK